MWEIKTGLTGEKVARTDINQVLGQVKAEKRYSHGAAVYGCLITPHAEFETDAGLAAGDNIALLQADAILAWFDALADRFREYVQRRGAGSAHERGEARTAAERRLPKPGWLERLLSPSNGRVRLRRQVDDEFASV